MASRPTPVARATGDVAPPGSAVGAVTSVVNVQDVVAIGVFVAALRIAPVPPVRVAWYCTPGARLALGISVAVPGAHVVIDRRADQRVGVPAPELEGIRGQSKIHAPLILIRHSGNAWLGPVGQRALSSGRALR